MGMFIKKLIEAKNKFKKDLFDVDFLIQINNVVTDGIKNIEYGKALLELLIKAIRSPLAKPKVKYIYLLMSKLYVYEKQNNPKAPRKIETKIRLLSEFIFGYS